MTEKLVREIVSQEVGTVRAEQPCMSLPTQMMKRKYVILMTFQHALKAIITFQ